MPTQKDGKIFFTPQEIEGFRELNLLIDGSRGGMLIGNYHSTGGIPVLKKCDDAEMYLVSAEFEGWEYLLCPTTMENHIEYLTKINVEFSATENGFEEYEFSENISRINTFLESEYLMLKNKFLILGTGDYFIVNKFSTKKYIDELDTLNKRYCW